MPVYSHAFDIAFEVISHDPDGEDVTAEMLVNALILRVMTLEDDEELIEAVGCPFDTYEVRVQ